MSTDRNDVDVETHALAWFKSSYSGSSGGDCLEVATNEGSVHVRDSKSPHSPVLSLTTHQWDAFLAYAAGAAVR